jgi:hypothetical protein
MEYSCLPDIKSNYLPAYRILIIMKKENDFKPFFEGLIKKEPGSKNMIHKALILSEAEG